MNNDDKSKIKETLVGMTIEQLKNETVVEGEDLEIWEATQPPLPTPQEMIPITRKRLPEEPAFLPGSPTDITSVGLSWSYIEELILKHIFQGGAMKGSNIIFRTALPTIIVEEALERLRKQQYIEITGSERAGFGRSQMILRMTEAGRKLCMVSMERDRYIGPAPVPWRYYQRAVSVQSIRKNSFTIDDIKEYFEDLVLPSTVFDAIGPAINSGKSLFFHGPPGNGKTAICQRITKCFRGDIFIPYAVMIDDFIIKIFDENLHTPVKYDMTDPGLDQRWVRCKRPMVIVGGELKLEDLQLSYSPQVKYYEAPIQLKANNGMLLVDDFGRQTVSPKSLLNRWIVPLESEIDFVSLHTGKKLEIPFDVFVVFSTNLSPKDLVDDAFLRRVRYKLEVKRPSEALFRDIFKNECKKLDIPWDKESINYLISTHYRRKGRPFNACEPRDLLSQVRDLCAYRGFAPSLSKEILDTVCLNYFVKF